MGLPVSGNCRKRKGVSCHETQVIFEAVMAVWDYDWRRKGRRKGRKYFFVAEITCCVWVCIVYTVCLWFEQTPTSSTDVGDPLEALSTLHSSFLGMMNWTGGQLQRHHNRSGLLTKAQKQNFARARLQKGTVISPPSPFRDFPDIAFKGSSTRDKDEDKEAETNRNQSVKNCWLLWLCFHQSMWASLY